MTNAQIVILVLTWMLNILLILGMPSILCLILVKIIRTKQITNAQIVILVLMGILNLILILGALDWVF